MERDRKNAKLSGRAATIRRLLEENEDLRCKVDALEAAVRGEQGIVFEGDYTKCPNCGAPTEWDRSHPPLPYFCDKCEPGHLDTSRLPG